MKFYQPKSYQPRCEKLFLEYRAIILDVLANAQIEHIGASAIPGCISKGDLDIYVAVEKSQHPIAIKKFFTLGFAIKQDTLRTEDLCMLENDGLAVQLVVEGTEFESFLHFRDALFKSPKLVEEYNRLKRNCEGMDMQEYRDIKSSFIEKVLANEL